MPQYVPTLVQQCNVPISGNVVPSVAEHLTLAILNCFNCIFRHLKLELLTQRRKIITFVSNIELLDYLASIKNYFIKFSDIFIDLKHVLKPYIYGHGKTRVN